MFSEVMDRFVEQSPASVMFRGTLENVVTAELLDEIFAQTAKRQVCGELLFSSIVDCWPWWPRVAASRSTTPTGPGKSSSPCRSPRCTTSSTAWKRKCPGKWSARPPCGWPKWSSGCRRGVTPLLRG